MAKQDHDPFDLINTPGISDNDAAPGVQRRPRGGDLPENEDLDSEGQPDLEGALPGKEITGDAQEGEMPPSTHYRVLDDGFRVDTLDDRLREEVPDRVSADVEEVRLIDDESFDGGGADDGGGPDHGGGELRSEFGDEGGYPSAEEAALHIVDEAPGAVKRDIDSYTGEPIDKLGTY
jgi:hypothetical protein